MHASNTYNEKDLLSAIASGNEEAFTRIFYRYHQKLGAFILRLSESQELTQEITQDVFLKIWTNRSALTDVLNFEAYLFTLAKNHAFNALRKLSREQLKKREWMKDTALTIYAGDEPDGLTENDFRMLHEAIGQLPPQQQKIYMLRSNSGMKYEEIAVRMGLSFETVKKHMLLARRAIRSYLGAHGNLLLLLMPVFFFF